MALTPTPNDDTLVALAGEYVLGTLPPAERAAFAARIAQDRAAAEAVRDWERRLAPLALRPDTGPAPDAARSWAAIAARIGDAPPVANAPRPLGLSSPANDGGALRSLRGRLNAWRAGAVALAAALAVSLVTPGLRTPAVAPAPGEASAPAEPRAELVAALGPPEGQTGLLLRVDPATGALIAQPVALSVPEGRQLQLWIIEGTAPPRPLGLLDPTRPVSLQLGEAAGALTQAVFAISVEPPGGSPTGAPTGPVIQTGRAVELSTPRDG
jgi:anti-sigma-K factor RskA